VKTNTRIAQNCGVRAGAEVRVGDAGGGTVKARAMVSERVGEGVAFMPFHYGSHFEGADLRDK